MMRSFFGTQSDIYSNMRNKSKRKVVKKLASLDFGIFPGHVLLCYNLSYDEIIKQLNKKKQHLWAYAIQNDKQLFDAPHWAAVSREIKNVKTGEIKKFYYIVIRSEFDYSNYDYCRLAHEILHICQFYLPEVLRRQDEKEAEAYLHTYLMMQCLNVMGKK